MNQPSDKLRSKLTEHQQRFGIAGPKPQGLPYREIVDRVAGFLLSQDGYRVAHSFGAGVLANDVDEGDRAFDPIWLYQSYPDQADTIAMYVEAELQDATKALLQESSSNLAAYNTLLFGIALRLARAEPLSEEFVEFLVNHLLQPQLPSSTKVRGRPKKFNDDDLLKKHAIKFATQHGLKITRNNQVSAKITAFDAVSDAALKLYQERKDARFATGYSYENLKKIWYK